MADTFPSDLWECMDDGDLMSLLGIESFMDDIINNKLQDSTSSELTTLLPAIPQNDNDLNYHTQRNYTPAIIDTEELQCMPEQETFVDNSQSFSSQEAQPTLVIGSDANTNTQTETAFNVANLPSSVINIDATSTIPSQTCYTLQASEVNTESGNSLAYVPIQGTDGHMVICSADLTIVQDGSMVILNDENTIHQTPINANENPGVSYEAITQSSQETQCADLPTLTGDTVTLIKPKSKGVKRCGRQKTISDPLASTSTQKSDVSKPPARRRRPKKPKKYEIDQVLENPDMEKKRQNAINAKKNRDLKKQKMIDLERNVRLITKERDELLVEVKALREREEYLKDQLKSKHGIQIFDK